ncbi:Rz1-like lysis system protein LysC [Achromobacter animicus]|uniref:Rz1-like lysis system protein LysC n=1 Tax=Achromobacter animicus TaxID=1389935 RepID=UPI003F5B25D1
MCATLAGCAQPTTPSTRPTLPVNLSAPCPPISHVDSSSWDDLAQAHAALAFQYAECAARHRAVVDGWTKATVPAAGLLK